MTTREDWLPRDWRRLPDGTVETVSHGTMSLGEALVLRDVLTTRTRGVGLDKNERRP